MVASNHRRLGGVSLLLLAASFAFLQQTQAFYDSPSRVSDLLGDHQVRVNQDGYVDFAETRVNIYGERSSVAYRYKPHFEKLKLRVDHSCFSVKSLDGKVILQAKNDLFSSRSSSHDCLHSSVTSLTSTEDFTGRTFAFSSQQPSIHDIRSGDILLGVSDMHGKPESFKITSVSQRSVASQPSKAEFEFAVQPVQITDLVSEGEYEFHTDNILTVNDIARSEMTTKGDDTQFGPNNLVSMNWNYNSGAGKASKAITFWQYQTASIQCTNCFARFTATATIKWMIGREHWYSTSVTVKFMAHVVMNAQMNVDVGFSFNGALSYSVSPVRLVRIQSMVGAALSSLSIFGVNLRIGLDYGLDISVGVDFNVEGQLNAGVGADAQCSYAVGIYHNYPKPYNQDGCSKQLHRPYANGQAGITIIPYISLQPYITIGFGDIVRATATVTIKPQVEFGLSFSVGSGFSVNGIVLRVPVTFDAELSVEAPLGLYSNSWSFGPYSLLNPAWQLMDHSHSISVRSQNLIPSIETSGKLRILSTGNQSKPLSSIKACQSCKISNDTMVWNPLTLSAALDTSTPSWQKVDASEDGVGTCTYTSGQVDARTVIFTAPSTGVYEVSSSLVQAAPDSTGNSWNVLARNGPNCCGILTFCSSISVDQPSSSWSVFLKQNDMFTMEYTSSVAGSDATIRVKISGSQDPIVYLDTLYGTDSNTGIFGEPVRRIEKALDLLASRITPQTIAATVIISPTFDDNGYEPMCPGRDYPKMAGYVIPTQLKNIDLTIKSVVRLRAPSIMFSWGKQASYGGYCNYLIDPLCAKSSAFRESVWGTAFDTEFKNSCEGSSSVWGVRRVFTFENFKSVTLDGLWFEGFRNHKDGGALYAENSTLILKNCWFQGNSALLAASGGVLYAKNSKILIDGTVFKSQKTHNYGGAITTIASDLEITRSVFSGALADKEGGFISFDSSKGNTISVTDSEFFEASAYSGAGIVINGGRSNSRRNSILNSRFAGLSASTKGGALILQNSNLKIALSEFKNTYSIDGSSVVESYSSSLEMSSNSFNYTGSPQAIFESSDIVEDKSLYSSGGTYCPLSACTANVMKNGKCDPICNVSLCGYDGGDCLCPIDKCPLSSRGNGVCDLGCATSGCGYDSGDCCNTDVCTFDLRNNGICNRFCNNSACNYDDGECLGVSSVGSQPVVSVAAPSSVSILRSTSSPVLLALDAYANNVIAQHDNRAIGKYLNINPTASAGTAAVPKASAIQCSSSTVSMGSTQVQVSNSDSTIQSSGCVGLTSCVNCGACGICRSSGCDTSMMDDACQTKVGAGAKCAPTIASASNNFSVTTCIAAGQQVSPASSADTSNKENKLSTGAIAGISIGALVFVAAVAVMVIAIVKRRASRQRNPREVMASMVEVQVDQAVMNPAAPAQGSADVDPTLVEVPANEHLL